LESLGKNARSLLLQGKRNINVSNLQNYFRIQNVGGLWRVSDCEELVGVTAFGTFIAVFEISFHNYGNVIPV